MFRFLLWRMLGLAAAFAGVVLVAWFLAGGPGRLLRGTASSGAPRIALTSGVAGVWHVAVLVWGWSPLAGLPIGPLFSTGLAVSIALLTIVRSFARHRRRYVRVAIHAYRSDQAQPEQLVRMLEALHRRLLYRWWRRLLHGQPSMALEVHHMPQHPSSSAWLGVSCPMGLEAMVESALRTAYPNCRLTAAEYSPGVAPAVLRLKKRVEFIRRAKGFERFERLGRDGGPPSMNRLITVMGACGESAFVQIALTPTPSWFEVLARHLFKHREAEISRERREHLFVRDRSMVLDAELRGGLEVQHSPLFFVDLRVVAPNRATCERIASELRVEAGENPLVERGTAVRHGVLRLYSRRVQRGEGNPLPPFRKGVFAPSELALLWQLPSVDYTTVPFARSGVPIAPAPPAIFRPRDSAGTLRDAHGPVSIHVDLRRQNTAVPGAVDQGKSSYLVATVAEDVRRKRCAIIVLDPKGDAADAALSVVPSERTCTLLDFANPTCGFNPLAVDAPADVIADYVVAALKNLFTDANVILQS